MKYLSPFRLASYLLVVFFAGHTAERMLAQSIFATIVTILLAAGALQKQRAG